VPKKQKAQQQPIEGSLEHADYEVMTCRKCKKEIPEGSLFCMYCGNGVEQAKKTPKDYEYERVTFQWNGKQYEASGKTLKEAHEKAARKQLALENGVEGISGNMTVSKWADEWLEVYKQHSVGEGQYENYELYLGIIKTAVGKKNVKTIKDIDLQRVLNDRSGKSKSDLSKLRMTMKALFKQARISRMIPFDPAENLKLPAAKDGTYRSVTQVERDNILELADTHYAGLWIKTILHAGLRPGETRALDWRHVDFGKRLISVEVAMKARTTRIGEPKSEKSVRKIPINDDLFPALWEARGDPFDPVFKQPKTGKRHTKSSMEDFWGNFKRELDIAGGAKLYRSKIIVSTLAPDLVPYCLRHTYGTDLQDAGVPINVAKYLMGHSDISVTANIYTHTTDEAIKEAAKKINAKLKDKNR